MFVFMIQRGLLKLEVVDFETMAPCEVISDDGSVAACGVLLQTQQADILVGELLEDFLQEDIATVERLLEITAQDAEIFFSLIPMSYLRRDTELRQMKIGDLLLGQRVGEWSLGEPSLAAYWTMPNVNDCRDLFLHQQFKELTERTPFIADSEDARPSTP
jgi:hypothetical protein